MTFSKHDYLVTDVDISVCKSLVARFHYSGRGSHTGTIKHGLIRKSDWDIVGCAWWLPPTKHAAMSVWDNWRAVLGLHRLVVHPDVPTNGASFLIGRSIRLIKQYHPRWEYLLTYADSGEGHDGTIYKATNWDYLGRTRGEQLWVDSDGKYISRKSTRGRTVQEMKDLGYHDAGIRIKHRYGMKL